MIAEYRGPEVRCDIVSSAAWRVVPSGSITNERDMDEYGRSWAIDGMYVQGDGTSSSFLYQAGNIYNGDDGGRKRRKETDVVV